MVKKKGKATKSSKKRGALWQAEDVQVHTALPPQVEGQLRCFCRLSINQVLWYMPSPPDLALVRIKWWGEDGEGSTFRPLDVKKGGDKPQVKTTARYPVRSGPKQFAAYLADMGSLNLEVLSGATMVPIGHCSVLQLSLLSPNRPVNGFFPVFSSKDEKIAELQVSVVLESLMASYDSSGSIPTTDLSMETRTTHDSTYPQRVQPMPYTKQPQKPLEDPFISPASQQNMSIKEYQLRESNADVRQRLNYDFQDGSKSTQANNAGKTVSITENGHVITTDDLPQSAHKIHQQPELPIINGYPVSTNTNPVTVGTDVLSVLLDRGKKLREEMIISSLYTGANNTQQSRKPHDFPIGIDFQLPPPNLSGLSRRSESTGSLLKEILKTDPMSKDDGLSDNEYKAVDLVMGPMVPDNLELLLGLDGSRYSSLSSDMDIASDPGDPIHSESLLQELFYKNMASDTSGLSELSGDEIIEKQKKADISLSVDDPGNMRPPSRHSSMSSLNMIDFPEPEKLKAPSRKKSETKSVKRKALIKFRKKRSKKRCGSRGSASDISDSEVPSTPRSEMSRVSFDMYPSDIEEPVKEPKKKKKTVDGLSVERLTLLGRVHVARVSINLLQLIEDSKDTSFSRKKSKVKLGSKIKSSPKASPKTKKSCTYFIEYQFPVVACSRDKFAPNAMATEVMRVVSKNVKDGDVVFNHRSVFPILFDGMSVEKWWRSALIFKVFSRAAGQKVPVLIGSCGIPLKSILKSESLFLERSLSVMDSSKNTSFNSSITACSQDGLVGTLKVSVELASDSRDFATALAKTRLAEISGKTRIVPILPPPLPQPHPIPIPASSSKPPLPPEPVHYTEPHIPYHIDILQQNIATQGNEEISGNSQEVDTLSLQHQVQQVHYPPHPQVVTNIPRSQMSQPEPLTLHMILLIPEGRNISVQGIPSLQMVRRHPIFPPHPSLPGEMARDTNTRNTYLVCRMFWCNDAVHSSVCWGTIDPQFNFTQIAPVMVSQYLLERMRNNFMIVEIWDKKTTAESDKLIGMLKLSLHQFYMSFRDRKISSCLLRSQFPVISVDNYMPIVDVFTGSQFGQLKVLLAMGSEEQVAALQRIKLDGRLQPSGPERPSSYLERSDVYNSENNGVTRLGTKCVVEHIFEIIVEGVSGLKLFENMIWGEADCFVQYCFLSQNSQADSSIEALPVLKSFRSATTLCIPDPVLNDITRHRIMLPQGTPVQREILTACAGVGGGGGGIPFEVWCRYYHPNVRDQCVAKATLPLAKLCAMITMQKKGESSVQAFSLSLTQVATTADKIADEEAKAKMESGQIEVTINYKQHLIQAENAAAAKNLSGAQVCISVAIQKASGLKSAAEYLAYLDTGMQYPSEVGVNAYVRVKLSFLSKKDERITRTVARAFAPEFSHHIDFPCPLLWTETDSSALCLAEILETAEASLELWHQVPGLSLGDLAQEEIATGSEDVSARRLVNKTGDVLLGSSTISLAALLTHRTGINGWFPLNLPPVGWNKEQEAGVTTKQGQKGLERVVGGLELLVKFAHHDDRERVINAGRGVGWSPVDLDVEEEDWESEDENTNRYHHVSITIDHITFPLLNALLTGQTTLDKTSHCYIRYKYYDKAAVVSKLVVMKSNDVDYLECELNHKHDMNIPASSPYKWYLREDRLELQVWLSYGSKKGSGQRPHQKDKLIGSAFISLEALNDSRRKQHRISGMYPLFKPGTASLGGAYLQAHVTSKPHFGAIQKDKGDVDYVSISCDEEMDADYDPEDSFHQLKSKTTAKTDSGPSEQVDTGPNLEASFPVHITIERAMHLPYIDDKVRSEECPPNSYVSYQGAESVAPSYTDVFSNSDNPVWDYEVETRLNTELLYNENKNLVLKVWHKPATASKSPDKSSDRVLGFVSVDLIPLTSGLHQICGWYNITDFNGQCRGQIKVNVVPLEPVSQYRGGITTLPSSVPQPHSLPTVSTTQNMWFPPPVSLPVIEQPFSTSPHFEEHYESVKRHHELLTQQVKEHLQRLTNNMAPLPAPESAPPSSQQAMFWTPTFPEPPVEESASSSILFSCLRKQMQDLDEVMNKFKNKLTVPPGQEMSQHAPTSHQRTHPSHLIGCHRLPVSDQSGPLTSTLTSTYVIGQTEMDVPMTSQSDVLNSAVSTISSVETNRSQRDNEMSEHSNPDVLLRNVVDSGAFSIGQSTDKDQDGSDTQRSCSDKLDTFRLGTTPRDFVGPAESDSGYHFGSTPRDEPNDSTNSIFQSGSTPGEDDISAMMTGFNACLSASDTASLGFTPRDFPFTPRENNGSMSSFRENMQCGSMASFMLENLPKAQSGTNADHSNGNTVTGIGHTLNNGEQKEMSIIQEFTETDHTESEGEAAGEYYQKYRAALTEEDLSEVSGEEVEEGDIIVPRTLNSVSGILRCSVDMHQQEQFSDARENPFDVDKRKENEPVHKPVFQISNDYTESTVQKFRTSQNLLSDGEDSDNEITPSQVPEQLHGVKQQLAVEDQFNCTDYGHQNRVAKTDVNREKPMKTLLSYVELEPNLEMNTRSVNIDELNLNTEFSDRDGRLRKNFLSNVDLDSMTSGSVAFHKSDSEAGSRVSSEESRNLARTLSEQSVDSSGRVEETLPTAPADVRNIFSQSEKRLDSVHALDNFDDSNIEVVNIDGDFPVENGYIDSDSDIDEKNGTVNDYSKYNQMPNFFLPVKHLEESMRALQLAATVFPHHQSEQTVDSERLQAKAQAAAQVTKNLTGANHSTRFNALKAKGRQLPTAEEAKRIAKIFSSKFK